LVPRNSKAFKKMLRGMTRREITRLYTETRRLETLLYRFQGPIEDALYRSQ